MNGAVVDTRTGEIVDTRSALPIDRIVVGDRARKDYGDLTDLVASIREHGLLQPVGVLPGNRLLFGGRRLEACKRLGMTSIPITRPQTRDDALAQLKAERDENTCRKEMTVTELVAVGRQIEELERPKARERQGTRTDLATSGARAPEVKPAGTTADAVGDALGISGSAYKRAKYAIDAQDDPDPEVAEVAKEAVKEMDATGSIRPAADKVRAARKPAPKPKAPPKFGGNRKKHLAVIDSIATAASGLAIAANEITGLDQTVTTKEAARLADDLSASIRALNRIKTLLKERTACP